MGPPRRTFSSLRVRNFRLFFIGQLVSNSGQWMHHMGMAWLVLSLDGAGIAVGLTTGLMWVPLVVLGPFAGLIADRNSKRILLMIAQIGLGLVTLAFGVLVVLDAITLPIVFILALLFGCVLALENPVRRAFIGELVPKEAIANAVGLNSSLMAASRALGPMIGGVVIATFGIAAVFFINAASYLALIFAVTRMDTAELRVSSRLARGPRQLREGFRYVASTPAVLRPLLMVATVGILAFNYQVLIPLMVVEELGEGPVLLGMLLAALSFGSFLGALGTARSRGLTHRNLAVISVGLSLALGLSAIAPNRWLLGAFLALVGFGATSFTSAANGLLQRDTEPTMLGRVLALFSVAFLGSSAIGSPLIGTVAEITNARVGFLVGSTAAIAAGLLLYRASSNEGSLYQEGLSS